MFIELFKNIFSNSYNPKEQQVKTFPIINIEIPPEERELWKEARQELVDLFGEDSDEDEEYIEGIRQRLLKERKEDASEEKQKELVSRKREIPRQSVLSNIKHKESKQRLSDKEYMKKAHRKRQEEGAKKYFEKNPDASANIRDNKDLQRAIGINVPITRKKSNGKGDRDFLFSLLEDTKEAGS